MLYGDYRQLMYLTLIAKRQSELRPYAGHLKPPSLGVIIPERSIVEARRVSSFSECTGPFIDKLF